MQLNSINSQLCEINSNIREALSQGSVSGGEPYEQKAIQEIDQLREQNIPKNVRKYVDAALNDLNEPYSNILSYYQNLCLAHREINKAEAAE